MLSLFSDSERAFAQAIARLGYCNPFLPERIEYEREALGSQFVETRAFWSRQADLDVESPNVRLIVRRVMELAESIRTGSATGSAGILAGESDSIRPSPKPQAPSPESRIPNPESQTPPPNDTELYLTLVLFLLYHRYYPQFHATALRSLRETPMEPPTEKNAGRSADKGVRAAFFSHFMRDAHHYLAFVCSSGVPLAGCCLGKPGAVAASEDKNPDERAETPLEPNNEIASSLEESGAKASRENSSKAPCDLESCMAHIFACFFQICRAFIHIYDNIIGDSMPAARLRAAAWQSIFTHDMRRYQRALYSRMADVTCLITGPSGTGKELVARAIGLSRYIPFDPRRQTFSEKYGEGFFPLNLSALSPTLIESELFGHRRGSFTGAIQDRIGWLEICPPLGSVFLDEIGDVDGAIQVKLLRVLQTRTFQRLGDTKNRTFHGKIIAATNRDLAAKLRAGEFRQDLYYRLCSDIIVAPTLAEQISDSPDVLPNLARFIAARIAGETEAANLADEVMDWITKNLPREYPWPGNVRELEQCVRNIMVRRSYTPLAAVPLTDHEALAKQILAGTLTADELLQRYCQIVYSQAGTYQETARRLNLDHRTVKSKIEGK